MGAAGVRKGVVPTPPPSPFAASSPSKRVRDAAAAYYRSKSSQSQGGRDDGSGSGSLPTRVSRSTPFSSASRLDAGSEVSAFAGDDEEGKRARLKSRKSTSSEEAIEEKTRHHDAIDLTNEDTEPARLPCRRPAKIGGTPLTAAAAAAAVAEEEGKETRPRDKSSKYTSREETIEGKANYRSAIDLTGVEEDTKPSPFSGSGPAKDSGTLTAAAAAAAAGTSAGEAPSWEVILLVDSREFSRYDGFSRRELVTALQNLGVACETRMLPAFDYLWVTRSSVDGTEVLLDHGIERKQIKDLAAGLDKRNKGTGLPIVVEQQMKMKSSNVRNKIYIIEGEVRHLYWENATTRKRVPQCIKEMESNGYRIERMPFRDTSATVAFLAAHHRVVESEVGEKPPPADYMHFDEFKRRVEWVVKVGTARNKLAKGKLGPKKTQGVLDAFPTEVSWKVEYQLDRDKVVHTLASLKTDGRKSISQDVARQLCSALLDLVVVADPSQSDEAHRAPRGTTGGPPQEHQRAAIVSPETDPSSSRASRTALSPQRLLGRIESIAESSDGRGGPAPVVAPATQEERVEVVDLTGVSDRK